MLTRGPRASAARSGGARGGGGGLTGPAGRLSARWAGLQAEKEGGCGRLG
jgi:hypothetical protein